MLADPAGFCGPRHRQGGVAVPGHPHPCVGNAKFQQGGAGAYLRALVASSLTTSRVISMAREETGAPWSVWMRTRKLAAT
ncbi:hypothetical protein AQJ46_50545 [Streptomyces canus]|uniref:Uncharacterized protein n=1 Tax=Streptomyces canus TaxID=58343 RepID=A0A101RK62_9ACTN|nr:hypothetical protein AQJ46_50545 [Streptomyces canus]